MGRQSGATGGVNWPAGQPEWKVTGEGGMWVHAFWLADFSTPQTQYRYAVAPDHPLAEVTDVYQRDPFIRCHGPETTICLPQPDCPVSDSTPRVYHPRPELDRDTDLEGYTIGVYDAGYAVLAAVCLGTSGMSFRHADTGEPWQCTEDDLSHQGLAALAVLDLLYGRAAVLVTYLDT